MTFPRRALAGVGVAAVAVAGYAAATQLDALPLTATETETVVVVEQEPNCEFGPGIPTEACFAAGIIRNVALYNLQGAAQFCVWRRANPGEWSRLKGYAANATPPTQIVTWFGGAIRNELEAYFATGAPAFPLLPNTAPNACRTPLPPSAVSEVTPGQTDATVTIQTTG